MHNSLPKLHRIFTDNLPADPITDNYCRVVEHAAYSFVNPSPTQTAQLICVNSQLAKQLGFQESHLDSDSFKKLVTGNYDDQQMKPYAQCYGGHQFGQWANQLGDGRAINLGQYEVSGQYYTLQLKGAGKTPYSRHADGMAVFRSSLREYLCSEAMFHLGIPTTRALSLALTGEQVIRDKLYDGNAAFEPCAITSRVSRSFLRFGSIELPSKRGDLKLLKETVHFSITQDFSHLIETEIDKSTYLKWYQEITDSTAKLISEWMRVGFVHGVLNTDNMSLLGETIDYGPYGWIDDFDLNWTPNTSDNMEKRYRFGQQAYIGQWNLFQLAIAIYPLIEDEQPLRKILNSYNNIYQGYWLNMMCEKVGLPKHQFNNSEEDQEQGIHFFKALESCLSAVETDMTIFYRLLASYPSELDVTHLVEIKTHFYQSFYQPQQVDLNHLTKLQSWLQEYRSLLQKLAISDKQRLATMNKVNPCYILRNFQVQQAIEAAEAGDFSHIKLLETVIKSPYQEDENFKQFAQKRPDWAKQKFGCSALSCSS